MVKQIKETYNKNKISIIPTTIRVNIYPAEEGGYWAESITIPGAFTQGDTIQETEKNMYESIDLLFEDDYPEMSNYTLEFEVCDA